MDKLRKDGLLGHDGVAYEHVPREEVWLEVDIGPSIEGEPRTVVTCKKHPRGSAPELVTVERNSPLLSRDPISLMGWVLKVERVGVNRFKDLELIQLPRPAESGSILMAVPADNIRMIENLAG